MPTRGGYTLTYGLSLLGTFVLGILPGPVLDLVSRVSEMLQ